MKIATTIRIEYGILSRNAHMVILRELQRLDNFYNLSGKSIFVKKINSYRYVGW